MFGQCVLTQKQARLNSALKELEAAIPSADDVQEIIQKQIVTQRWFEQEVMTEFDSLQKINDNIRTKIGEVINSDENVCGYLMGAVDDYLEIFEPQKERLKEQFRKNREHLEWQASGKDPQLNEDISTVRESLETIRIKMRGMFVRKKKAQRDFVLKDLPNFGSKLDKSKENFRTLTEDRVKELELLKAPGLKAIKTYAS